MYREILPENCPPAYAGEINDVLYRIVNNNIVLEEDFIPYSKKFPENPRYKNNCKAHAVSFYKEMYTLLKTYRNAIKNGSNLGKYIASLEIKPNLGKSVINSNGHVSLWFYKDVNFDKLRYIEIREINEIR